MSVLDRFVVATLPFVPKFIVGKIAAQYIAGETQDDAMRVVRDLNGKGLMATVDVLGEFVTERSRAEESTSEYQVL